MPARKKKDYVITGTTEGTVYIGPRYIEHHGRGHLGTYDAVKCEIIVNSLLANESKADAARKAGIRYDTFKAWYKNIPEFRNEVDSAIEEVMIRFRQKAIDKILKTAETTWQAAAWWLERTYPTEFGKYNRTDVNVTEKKIVFQIGIGTSEDNIPTSELTFTEDIKILPKSEKPIDLEKIENYEKKVEKRKYVKKPKWKDGKQKPAEKKKKLSQAALKRIKKNDENPFMDIM